MSKVKTGMRNKNPWEIYHQANLVLKRMENNPCFPSPNEYVERVREWRDKLREGLSMEDTKLNLTKRNTAHKELMRALASLASYIFSISGADAVIILSTGFDVRKKRTETKLLAAPVMKCSMKGENHSVKLMWRAVRGAKGYHVYLASANNRNERTRVAISTKSSTIIKGLESGKVYYVSLTTFNTAGESGLSNEYIICEAWA